MQLRFNRSLAARYRSASQVIRVLTEDWVGQQAFCPSCGSAIRAYENNRPVADFYCPACYEEYELKSKGTAIGSRILDGAYQTAVDRLRSNRNPNLFLLSYDRHNYEVVDFLAIPKYFFVPDILEKRKPLSANARRAGWVGCNFMLDRIPQAGRIFYVRDKTVLPGASVLDAWKKTLFLQKETEVRKRGWTLDVMHCIDSLGKEEFTLHAVYDFEDDLQSQHPRNRHVKAKIRQQLQILRDNGYLEFLGKGEYRLS